MPCPPFVEKSYPASLSLPQQASHSLLDANLSRGPGHPHSAGGEGMSQPWDNSSPAHSEELLFPAPCHRSLWSHVPKPAAPSPAAFLEWPCLPGLCKCWSSLAGRPLVLRNRTASLGGKEIRKRKVFDVNIRGNLPVILVP